MTEGTAMSDQTSTDATEQSGEEKNRKFLKKIAGLRLARKNAQARGKKSCDLDFFNRVVEFAEDCFSTPEEFATYAIPYFLSAADFKEDYYKCIPDPIENFMPLVKKWGLSEHPETIIAMIGYATTGIRIENFLNKYSALLEKYLPEQTDCSFVLDHFLRHYRFDLTHDYETTYSRTLNKIVKEYIPPEKYLETYRTVKASILTALTEAFSETPIWMWRLEHSAKALLSLGQELFPDDKSAQKDVLDDIVTLLTQPERYFPDKDVNENTNRPQTGRILYEAKQAFSPSSLNEADYEDLLKFLRDSSKDSLSDKIRYLTNCAEQCLSDKTHVGFYVEGVLQLGKASLDKIISKDKKEIPTKISSVVTDIAKAFKGLVLTDDESRKFKDLIQNSAVEAAANEKLDDTQLYDILTNVLPSLTPKVMVEWIEELTPEPFLDQSLNRKTAPTDLLSFLKGAFDAVAKKTVDETTIIATPHAAAGRVAGDLVIVFAATTVRNAPTDQQPVVYYYSNLLSASAARECFADRSSHALVKNKHRENFDKIVAALKREPKVA